jgi:hypothetical protein
MFDHGSNCSVFITAMKAVKKDKRRKCIVRRKQLCATRIVEFIPYLPNLLNYYQLSYAQFKTGSLGGDRHRTGYLGEYQRVLDDL